ncbi:MAG: hypothetical protein ACRDRL_15755 [Sciscionella sp.]
MPEAETISIQPQGVGLSDVRTGRPIALGERRLAHLTRRPVAV